MHKLLAKPFELSDFSFDRVCNDTPLGNIMDRHVIPTIDLLNELRDYHREIKDKKVKKEVWYTILQILPESYNQLRTWDLNYETLIRIHYIRKNHKQTEWVNLCKWIEELPLMREILEITEPKEEELDTEYGYKHIILDPSKASSLIGKMVYVGATPMECLNNANNHKDAVKLLSIDEENACPFIMEDEELGYPFIIASKQKTIQ